MKKTVIAFLLIAGLYSCGHKEKTPDVSHIKISLPVARFEQDFFNIDVTNVKTALDSLNKKHPGFIGDYLNIVMGYDDSDSALKYIPYFIKDSLYRGLYNETQKNFADFTPIRQQISEGLKYVKHYFPKYEAPTGIITFIGPVDGIATGISGDHRFAIGLQGYMGKDYPAYHTSYIANIYPAYKSRKFEPAYIPVNCMLSVIDDLYPARLSGKPLVEQMIEAGKRLYLLDKFLPETPDSVKTGYTQAQLDGAIKNESNIWGYFVTNNLLYNTDPTIIRDYMNEGPNTPPLGPASPGFIGQFVGWQIVKKWMDRKEKSLEELLKTPARQILDEAKYKPS